MNKKLSELKEIIFRYESDNNPFYDINPNIKVSDRHKKNVKYKVEYISKLDPKWRKWYYKDESISDIIESLREIRLNNILKNPDN